MDINNKIFVIYFYDSFLVAEMDTLKFNLDVYQVYQKNIYT